MRGGKGQLEKQVVVEGPRVEDSVVGEDGVVQVDAVLSAVNTIQFVFRIHTGGLLVASARADLVQIIALNSLAQHVCTLVPRKEEVLEGLVDAVRVRVLHRGGGKFNL